MFAAYWPVMAFVAAIVLIFAVLSVSLGKLCRARLDPLPERDLTTYLPEDVSACQSVIWLVIESRVKLSLPHTLKIWAKTALDYTL